MNKEYVKEKKYIQAVIEIIPSALFVVDPNFNIIDLNPSATTLFKLKSEVVLHRLCGEVMNCKNAFESEGGCGTSELCPECVLRNSVKSACEGRKIHKKKYKLEILKDGNTSEMHFLVSATPFSYDGDKFVLLAIEDVTELIVLQRLLPICSYCKKIRNDKEYWEKLEDYLRKHRDLRFTHSICPECRHKHYSDLGF